MSVRVVAPGKVNLYLAVGPVDASGYHPLATVFQALDIADDVVVRPSNTLSLSMPGTDLPVDETNLSIRAARALAAHAGIEPLAEIEIIKRIPIAGGMAGGSADAAGTLLALDVLWGLQTPQDELLAIAATLGADVPFILVGGTALGARRGDLITPLRAVGHYTWVLITQQQGHSTPEAFRVFDENAVPGLPQPVVDPEFLEAVAVGDVGAVVRDARNDLAQICLARHSGARAAADACESLDVPYLVSGSGPTIAALCESGDPEALRAELAARLTGATCLIARGPARGAHLA
ncbi:4-diphosphocytidyl-2-C-methyl-D-erythritol kinase [Ruaniaceae bacterium KH17]|nr:4-diphosphocytidyl-2-C-methyl-D-erythritol kinase [Ruaniaceae bacterium KH17]